MTHGHLSTAVTHAPLVAAVETWTNFLVTPPASTNHTGLSNYR